MIMHIYIPCTGPMEMLSFASVDSFIKTYPGWPTPKCEFIIDYVAETRDPITPSGGAQILPSKTFAEVEGKQYDILLVPGGMSLNAKAKVDCTDR
jgi:putative intracellular protease/amidase